MKSFVIIRGCTVECPFLNPNWFGSIIFCLSSCSVICFIKIFSYILLRGDSCAIGRQLSGFVLSFFCLKIGVIFETFNLWGNLDSCILLFIQLVNSLIMWGRIFFRTLLEISSGLVEDLLARDLTANLTSFSVISVRKKGSLGPLLFSR